MLVLDIETDWFPVSMADIIQFQYSYTGIIQLTLLMLHNV